MSESALRRVMAAVVVLGLVYLGVQLLGGGDEGGPLTDDPVTTRFLQPVRAEGVTAIRVRRPELSLDLSREDGGWAVNEYGADTTTVRHFLRALREAEVQELSSRNPRNHPAVGVAADSSWTLRVVTGTDTTPLLHVGREGPYERSLYVRVDGDDRVYLLQSRLRSLLGAELIQWREKRVTAVDTSRVAEIDVRRRDGSYRLRRSPDGWRVDGEPVSPSTVRGLLEELHGMDAYAFASDTSVMGEPTRSVDALDARGDTLGWIRAAPATSGEDWVVRSYRGDGAIYRVDRGRMDRLSPAEDSLLAPPGG